MIPYSFHIQRENGAIEHGWDDSLIELVLQWLDWIDEWDAMCRHQDPDE